MFRAFHNALPTKLKLLRRRTPQEAECELCKTTNKDTLHMLCDNVLALSQCG